MTENSPDNEKSDKADKKRREDLIATAKKRIKIASDANSENKRKGLEELIFSLGDQWPDEIKKQRQDQNRPYHVVNKINTSLNQVTNEQKQNKSSIQVSPVDDIADPATAKIYQGLVRHIETDSNGDVAESTAFVSSVRARCGFYRVITEFCDPLSFDQDIKIKSVNDPMLVEIDPHSQELDGSDMNWGFVFEDVNKDDYMAEHPNTELAQSSDWSELSGTSDGWVKEDSVRIAEYFYKEWKEQDIFLMPGKIVATKEELQAQGIPEAMAVAKRKTMVPTIKWCKINGIDIIDEKDWAGKYIPIIPVYGARYYVDGKKVLHSLVTQAQDPQRMYNYWASAETETIALAPKAPWIAAEGQIEKHKHIWNTSNIENHPVLPYTPKSIDGTPVPPPARVFGEANVQSITNARMLSSDDLKSTTGLFDAAMGNQSNETSGRAINARTNQAQTANFHFSDHLNISKKHLGRILVDLIPKIYDTERVVRILGEEGEQELVKINADFNHNGKNVRYDMGVGKYDVTISTGPAFATKRQEARESMLEFAKIHPPAAQVLGDLIAKNMDWPGAEEIAERLRKILPPGIAKEKDGDRPQVPPEMQQQMQQQGQMIEQLTEKLNEAQEEMRMKKYELDSKERIEYRKLEVQAEIELAKLGSKEGLVLLQEEIASLHQHDERAIRKQEIEIQGAGLNEPMAPQQINEPAGGELPGGMEY